MPVEIETLRRISHALFWLSIISGAGFGVAKFYVDRLEKRLSGQITQSSIKDAKDVATAAHNDASAVKQSQSQITKELKQTQTVISDIHKKGEPRHLTETQKQAMLPFLKQLQGKPVAFVCKMNGGESCDYATELATFFHNNGCKIPAPNKSFLDDVRDI